MWYINGRGESLPLTDMRYTSGWVESIVFRRKVEDFYVIQYYRRVIAVVWTMEYNDI